MPLDRNESYWMLDDAGNGVGETGTATIVLELMCHNKILDVLIAENY